MVHFSILILSLVTVIPHFGDSSLDADFPQSLQKPPCWLCDVPRCQQCVVSQWTAWSQCSSPCGNNGFQSRTRQLLRPPSCINGSCQHLETKEWQPCNRLCQNGGSPARWFCKCPVSYTGYCCETAFSGWSSWGDWGKCSNSCGSDVQERMRVCISPSQSNSSVCVSVCSGPSVEKRRCFHPDCPVQYDSLGCFRDGTPRSLPLSIKNLRGNIDWRNMTKTVQACAKLVRGRGLAIFGIQFYGECWSGVDSQKTYDKYGPSQNCWNGVGKERSNFVYKIKA